MSHECPECYALCHCNGDVDDIPLNLPEDQAACTHYKTCDPEDEDDPLFDDPFEKEDV